MTDAALLSQLFPTPSQHMHAGVFVNIDSTKADDAAFCSASCNGSCSG